MAELGLVKQAVKVPLVEVLALVKEVHEGVSTVNQELALCPVADLEDDLASEAASRASEEDEAALLTLSLSISLTLTQPLDSWYPEVVKGPNPNPNPNQATTLFALE